MKWISPEVSSLAMSGAVLLGMALATIPTTCHAFVVLPSSCSFISERQVVLGSQHNFLSRGAVGAPIMAVSHAAAEEIENADEVPKLKDPVSISDFEALDIRVGRIVLAESIPDPEHDMKPSRKYLSLVVDLGNEKRRVVSSIRAIVDVEDAIGKPVLIAANVEEETILGRPSRGRLLSASNFSKQPMPRTLRTVLLGGGGVPPGSAVSGL